MTETDRLALTSVSLPLQAEQILALWPSRPTLLLVDRIVEVEAPGRIVGLKCVSADEPFFAGHFPHYPVMPGVLIVEALAQTAATLLLLQRTGPGESRQTPFLSGVDRCRFRAQVRPGDVLRLEVELAAREGGRYRGQGRALVGDTRACEVDLELSLLAGSAASSA